jgi:hypothetical protein
LGHGHGVAERNGGQRSKDGRCLVGRVGRVERAALAGGAGDAPPDVRISGDFVSFLAVSLDTLFLVENYTIRAKGSNLPEGTEAGV